MKKHSSSKAFAAFYLSWMLLSASLHAELLVKDGQKVAFMGDSITDQGWNVPGGYVRLVVAGLQTLGVTIVPIPAGVGGNTSADMVSRFDRDVLSKKPDWLTLSCGVNDVWHGPGGVALEPYEKNITSIVDQAQAAGIKVMILTATVIGEEVDNDNNKKLVAYNEFLHQLAQDRNLPIAEENEAFQAALKAAPPSPGTKLLTIDGVHPNPDGHQIMATALLQAFGATVAQIETIKQEWLDMPASAAVPSILTFRASDSLTIRQYNALKAAAAAKNTSVPDFGNGLFFQALESAVTAHQNDTPPATMGQVEGEAQKEFAKKIAALSN